MTHTTKPLHATPTDSPFKGRLVEFDRMGEFQIETFGDFHCSTLPRPRVQYHVHIDATDESLDQRGFLFDQLDCPTYFDHIGRSDLSCELLARKAAQELSGMILKENPHATLLQITVLLSPEPFEVKVTEHWTLEAVDHIDTAPSFEDTDGVYS